MRLYDMGAHQTQGWTLYTRRPQKCLIDYIYGQLTIYGYMLIECSYGYWIIILPSQKA